MKHISALSIVILFAVVTFSSCNKPKRYSLIIENASVFDTKTGEVIPNKTILINADTIVGIIDAGEPVRTKKVVDAEGRLVVPGNIDASMHLDDAFQQVKTKVAETHPKSLTSFYRNKFTKQFLPYGVTLALDMGQIEEWQNQTSEWNSHPKFTELLTASIIEANTLTTPVKEVFAGYVERGIKYVYAGNTLDSVMLKQVVEEAKANGIVVFAKPHESIAFNGIVQNIEGMSELLIDMVKKFGNEAAFEKVIANIYGTKSTLSKHIVALEAFNYLITDSPNKLNEVAVMLGKYGVNLTSTLHLMANAGGLFVNSATPDSLQVNFTKEQIMRIEYNFKHLLSYVKELYDNGVQFRIGTNSPNGGRAFIDEQMILAQAGIPISDIIQISSYRTAKVLRIDNWYGSIEPGKKADLIVYEQNPLDDYRYFETPRRVIKNGKIYRRNRRKVELEEIK